MTPIGETLRRERLRRNLDLEQISRELKISHRHLDSIENEQFDRLPGVVFAKSFVKQYGRLLELDGDEMAEQVQRLLEPEVPEAAETEKAERFGLRFPAYEQVGMPAWRSIAWSAALVLVAVLVCSGVYVFWQQARSRVSTQQAQQSQASPQRSPQSDPGAQTASSARLSPQTVGSVSEADRVAQNALPVQQPSPAVAAQGAPIQQTAADANSDPNAPVRLKITAQEPVWVRASANGKYMFSGTLESNESRDVDAAGQVELLVGNAGGLNIELNGRPIGPVGPRGQVRTVHLRSGGFNVVPPKPAVPVDRF